VYSRPSRQLLDLRDDERRFARARDYEGAKSVQRRADQRAEAEREAIKKSRNLAWKRRVEQIKAHNARAVEGFDQHHAQKLQALVRQHDKLIESLTMMVQTTSQTIRDLRCRTRAGTDLVSV
jgi:hypothetical protein